MSLSAIQQQSLRHACDVIITKIEEIVINIDIMTLEKILSGDFFGTDKKTNSGNEMFYIA